MGAGEPESLSPGWGVGRSGEDSNDLRVDNPIEVKGLRRTLNPKPCGSAWSD